MKKLIVAVALLFCAAIVSTSYTGIAGDKKAAKTATHKHKTKGCCDMRGAGDENVNDCCKSDSKKESEKTSKDESKKEPEKK